jgi:transposase
MPKKTKLSGSSTTWEIEAAYKGSVNPHDHKRLIALQMAQQGIWILAEIGRAIGKGRSTVGRWLKSYREEGMEGMLDRGHGGRKPQLAEADIEALEGVLRGPTRQLRKYGIG